jgi:lipoprotein-releasing system permease protein
LNFPYFIARRLTYASQRSFTRVIIRIALLAMILSVAIMVISDAIVIGFQSEIKNKITGFEGHIQVSKTRTNFSFENEPLVYNDTFVRQLYAIKDIAHVQSFATKPGILKTEEGIEGIVLKGIDTSFAWRYFMDKMVAGKPISLPDTAEQDPVVVHTVISKYLADKLQLKVGDDAVMYFVQQPVRMRKIKVTGIYQTNIEELDKVFVLVDIRHIRALNDWDSSLIGGYEMFIKDPEASTLHIEPYAQGKFPKGSIGIHWYRTYHIDEVNEEVRYLTDISEDAKTIKERYPQIYDWLGLLDVNVQVILTLMAIVAIINMTTALIIMIMERVQMVGVLKSLGATNWQIRKIFVYNAGWLILTGIIVGNAIAIGLMLAQQNFHLIKLSEESYYVSEAPVYFSWGRILLINGGIFLACFLAMLLPSFLVTRISPIKAIRFE